MSIWNAKTEKTGLQEARDQAVTDLRNLSPDDVNYDKTVKTVDTLSKLIVAEKDEKLSPNTVAIVVGNIIVAAAFTTFERTNIVTTKVIPFLMKAIK